MDGHWEADLSKSVVKSPLTKNCSAKMAMSSHRSDGNKCLYVQKAPLSEEDDGVGVGAGYM